MRITIEKLNNGYVLELDHDDKIYCEDMKALILELIRSSDKPIPVWFELPVKKKKD